MTQRLLLHFAISLALVGGDALAAIGDAPGDDAEAVCDGVMTEHSDSHSELGSQGVAPSILVSAAWATT